MCNINEDTTEIIKACRLCLGKNAEHEVFSKQINSTETPCLEMISSLFTFPVKQDNRLPSKICLLCKDKVSMLYNFKIVAENVQKKLQSLISETIKIEEFICSIDQYKESNVKEKINTNTTQINYSVKTENLKDFNHIVDPNCESADDFSENTNQSEDFDEEDEKPLLFVKPLSKFTLAKCAAKDKAKKQRRKKISFKALGNTLTSRIDENGRTKYLCDICPKEFTDKSSRRRHRNVQHFGVLYYCKICKKNYRSKASHESYHKSDINKKYQCPECTDVFTTYYALQCHKKIHSNQSEYNCNVCDKKFAEKHLALSHKRRVHDKERPHECTYCSKTFFSSHSLKDHITTHTKIRRYDCKECGMLFTTSTILKEHEMRHTGNKDFACQFCEKRFYRKKDLTRHELIHSKSYEHQCSYCGLKFRRKDHLSTHERGVHNILKNDTKN